MQLKASVAAATLAITLSMGAGARAETCQCARQPPPHVAGQPVIVEEYYPHSDRRPAPVNAAYTPASPSDDYGFPDFDYEEQDLGYALPYAGGYGYWPYGFNGGRRGPGFDNDRIWDNDRGGGHSRIRPGPIGMGRR
jgi:hypothetical protein